MVSSESHHQHSAATKKPLIFLCHTSQELSDTCITWHSKKQEKPLPQILHHPLHSY